MVQARNVKFGNQIQHQVC